MTSPRRPRRAISAPSSSRGATTGAHVERGHHRDVVDRKHVGRIGASRAAACARRRRRSARTRSGARSRRDQARGGVVDRELAEVDEVDAEALGDDARQLVRAEHAVLDEHAARVAAVGARLDDRRVDRVAVGVAEVDDDFADERGPSGHASSGGRGPGASLRGVLDREAPRRGFRRRARRSAACEDSGGEGRTSSLSAIARITGGLLRSAGR